MFHLTRSTPFALVRRIFHAVTLALAALLMATSVTAQEGGSAPKSLAWPATSLESRPWTRWWWMGNIVNEKTITEEMEKYAKAGLGGVEITPIYGVKGHEDRFINYLSPEWMKMLVHSLKEGRRLGLGVDMATGTGWPFGGQWVGADHACKNVVHTTYTLKGGDSLKEPVRAVQRPMARAVGRRLRISELTEPIGANENLQALALEQVRFEKPLPLKVLMAYSDQGATLNLTDRVDQDGRLNWTAPAGTWTLYAIFQGWHGKMVERAGPGGEGNVIDHFSEEALKAYLRKFDRAFDSHDVSSLRAYFNDSYEVDDAAGNSDWTPEFFGEFAKRRGYDLRDHLPALFGNSSAEKNTRVLCDYRETISDLLLEEFTIPWNEWAKGKGATTRNQAHGSPANILDLYAASGIPETEGSDILKFMFASSAAHVTGKPLASSESATWLDEHFLATLADVKQALDLFFLGGINHICYHGTTFSPADEEWPGWLFYASVHFGPTNSFWNDFSTLNEYVTRVQSFLQSGQPDNDVLLYFPIYDRWSERGRSILQHFAGGATGTSAHSAGLAMLQAGYTFNFISDRQLGGVEFTANALQASGGASYEAVVLPECRFIPLSTFEKLVNLARAGATIIVHNRLPADVPGWGALDERQTGFKELIALVQFARTGNPSVQEGKVGAGRFLLGDDLGQLLSQAGIKREPMVAQGVQFVRRKQASGRCYFIVNTGNTPVDGWIPLGGAAQSAGIFNPMSGKNGLAALRPTETSTLEIYLALAPGESRVVQAFESAVDGPSYPYWRTKGPPHPIEGNWSVKFLHGGPQLPTAVETTLLRSWTDFGGEAVKVFSGAARYTIEYELPEGEADGWLLDLGRVGESARVKLNGEDLGTLITAPFQLRVHKDLMKEKNTLEVIVSNSMANRIAQLDRQNVNWKRFYNINFPARRRANRGRDGLFSAAAWPPKESGLMGPVTLTPLESMAFERPGKAR